MTVRLSVQI